MNSPLHHSTREETHSTTCMTSLSTPVSGIFLENCDNIAGFNVIVDTSDAFSGVGCDLVRYLADEIPKSSILTCGIHSHHDKLLNKVNAALSLHELSSFSSVYIPLWQPEVFTVSLQPDQFRSNAVLGAAIESITLPTRINKIDFSHFCSIVNSTSHTPVASLATGTLPSYIITKPLAQVNWMFDLSLKAQLSIGPEWGNCSVLRASTTSLDKFSQAFPTPPNCSEWYSCSLTQCLFRNSLPEDLGFSR